METQRRIIGFVEKANWVFLIVGVLGSYILFSTEFTLGVLAGGLIVTLNFQMMAKTLKKAFATSRFTSWHVILVKYYIRLLISAVIIFILIFGQLVNPLGLIIGLSVVVASIMTATVCEVKKIIFKEAI